MKKVRDNRLEELTRREKTLRQALQLTLRNFPFHGVYKSRSRLTYTLNYLVPLHFVFPHLVLPLPFDKETLCLN